MVTWLAAYSWRSTTPTPTPTSSRGSSRQCRRVVQLAVEITSGNRACRTCRRGSSRGCPCRCRRRRIDRLQCSVRRAGGCMVCLDGQLWYTRRPGDDDMLRGRAYSTCEVQDSSAPTPAGATPAAAAAVAGEASKLATSLNLNGDLDLGEINLSDMNPDDIRVSPVCSTCTPRASKHQRSPHLISSHLTSS